MPRRSGGGFGGGRRSSPTRSSTTAQAPPKQTPMAQQQSGGFLSNMAGTFMTGIGLGAGSEVGHQAMRGLMGGGSHQGEAQGVIDQSQPMQQQAQPQMCSYEGQNFTECLKRNSDINLCQSYMDALKQCQSQSGM